jgi:hypothetical protein
MYVGAAVAECANVLLLSEWAKNYLYAVPFGQGGSPAQVALGSNIATRIAFEPVTGRAFMAFQGSVPALGAYQLGGTATAPTLAALSFPDWSPPADLAIDIVAAPQPSVVTDASCGH